MREQLLLPNANGERRCCAHRQYRMRSPLLETVELSSADAETLNGLEDFRLRVDFSSEQSLILRLCQHKPSKYSIRWTRPSSSLTGESVGVHFQSFSLLTLVLGPERLYGKRS